MFHVINSSVILSLMTASISLCGRVSLFLGVYIFSNHSLILSHVNSTGAYAIERSGDRGGGPYLKLRCSWRAGEHWEPAS